MSPAAEVTGSFLLALCVAMVILVRQLRGPWRRRGGDEGGPDQPPKPQPRPLPPCLVPTEQWRAPARVREPA